MPKKPRLPETKSPSMRHNETWNTCVSCNKNWKDTISTPGLLHRFTTCLECLKYMNNE